MAIGDDIKETYEEVGIPFTGYSFPLGTQHPEYCLVEKYTEQSTEFIRQNVVVINIVFDSMLEVGDYLLLEGIFYLVTSKDSTRVENEVAFYRCMLFKCNVSVDWYKWTPDRGYDADYNKLPEFTKEKADCVALFLENVRGTGGDNVEEVYYSSSSGHTVYSQQHGFSPGDRLLIEGLFYLVENMHNHRLAGVSVLFLKKVEDDTATY